MQVDQKIIGKLQKLLALSASDNENEAALAMKKAQALMNEHNLTTMDVASDGSGAHVKDQKVQGLTKSRQRWESDLGYQIAKAFDGTSVVSRRDHGWYMTFIAAKTDMEIIIDLYERLRQTIRRMSKCYVESKRQHRPYLAPKTLHNSYRRGMVLTIHNRLQALKEHTRPDADIQNQYGLTGMDLIVVKNQAVNQRKEKLFDNLKKDQRVKFNVDTNAYQRGRQDGNNISLHQSLDGNQGPVAITQ